MNHLVILDAQAGELERILSGVKTMLISDLDPTPTPAHPVHPGDSLYFLRDKHDPTLRVKAAVVRILHIAKDRESDLSQTLKELQPRLQLTEDQYSRWSTREQALLVEIESVHKISPIVVPTNKIAENASWTAFEDLSQMR